MNIDPEPDKTAAEKQPSEALAPADEQQLPRPACPVCGGRLVEVRAKLECSECHRIVETCCERDRG